MSSRSSSAARWAWREQSHSRMARRENGGSIAHMELGERHKSRSVARSVDGAWARRATFAGRGAGCGVARRPFVSSRIPLPATAAFWGGGQSENVKRQRSISDRIRPCILLRMCRPRPAMRRLRALLCRVLCFALPRLLACLRACRRRRYPLVARHAMILRRWHGAVAAWQRAIPSGYFCCSSGRRGGRALGASGSSCPAEWGQTVENRWKKLDKGPKGAVAVLTRCPSRRRHAHMRTPCRSSKPSSPSSPPGCVRSHHLHCSPIQFIVPAIPSSV